VLFKNDVSAEQFARADHVTQESSLIVRGTVRADSRAPLGYEINVTDLQVLQLAESYPITPKEHGVAFLLDHRHLWLRSSRQHAILRVRSAIIRACRDYFDGKRLYAARRADFHTGGLRGHHDAICHRLFR